MAAPIISYIGISKVLDNFDQQKNPFWKIFVAQEARSVIATNFDIKDFDKSRQLLKDVLENINPDNIYTLESYKLNADKSSRYTQCDTSINFAISEIPKTMGYVPQQQEPQRYDSAAVKDKIDLIHQNAALIAEIGILKYQNEVLNRDILEAKSEIVDLKTELQSYDDDEDDEEEEKKMSGIQGAIAALITEQGGALIGKFISKNGAEKKELDGEVKIGAMGDAKDLSGNYTLQQLLTELDKKDPKLHYHLYKLVLVAQQNPVMFKMFLTELENL